MYQVVDTITNNIRNKTDTKYSKESKTNKGGKMSECSLKQKLRETANEYICDSQ